MQLLAVMQNVPLWFAAVCIMAIAEIYSVGLMLWARNTYGVNRLSLNNEVAGFKFAVVGVFYAVFLAFVVIAVWEDYSDTEAAVRNEAKAAVDLYQVTFALPVEAAGKIRGALNTYMEGVQKDEWPAMGRGESSPAVATDLEKLSAEVFAVKPQDQRELVLYQHALAHLTVMTDNRNERLDSANGSMTGILWFVLIVGGLITLGYPAFFASSNRIAQVLMTAALAALVAMSLLLSLAFDFPFTGNPHISDRPFQDAQAQMQPNWPPP